jgi:hypothetical protein
MSDHNHFYRVYKCGYDLSGEHKTVFNSVGCALEPIKGDKPYGKKS